MLSICSSVNAFYLLCIFIRTIFSRTKRLRAHACSKYEKLILRCGLVRQFGQRVKNLAFHSPSYNFCLRSVCTLFFHLLLIHCNKKLQVFLIHSKCSFLCPQTDWQTAKQVLYPLLHMHTHGIMNVAQCHKKAGPATPLVRVLAWSAFIENTHFSQQGDEPRQSWVRGLIVLKVLTRFSCSTASWVRDALLPVSLCRVSHYKKPHHACAHTWLS